VQWPSHCAYVMGSDWGRVAPNVFDLLFLLRACLVRGILSITDFMIFCRIAGSITHLNFAACSFCILGLSIVDGLWVFNRLEQAIDRSVQLMLCLPSSLSDLTPQERIERDQGAF